VTGWELIGRLWRFQHGIFEAAADVFAELGLYPKTIAVLYMLRHFRHPADVARALAIPLPTMSNMLRELEAKGLITRELDPQDRRRIVLSLTDRGEDALTRGQAAIDSVLAGHLESLSEGDRAAIARAIELFDGMLTNPYLDPHFDQR